jgi:hypothetical protein
MNLSNQRGTARRFFEREKEDVELVMAKTRINFHPVWYQAIALLFSVLY